jgi:hypothetical protein
MIELRRTRRSPAAVSGVGIHGASTKWSFVAGGAAPLPGSTIRWARG